MLSTSDGSNNKGVIRHSGRALIRGKIRRVWRPRFLELCDSGLVRYYELSSTTSSSNNNDNTKEDTPKCTLQVFSARIIDVTTLRDVHVGLPMGSFGFVFHAQRYTTPMFNTSNTMECHPPENVQPRDFLCAVGTLEEAQSWVVALQWAASERRRDDEWQDDDDFYVRTKHAFQVTTPSSLSSRDKQPLRRHHRQRKQSKTVVTKVQSLQLVRAQMWHLEWAYSIRMLLLRTQQSHELKVEERVILRTLKDIRDMLMQLQREVTHEKSRQVLEQVQLPETMVWYSEYVASMPHVDRVLRALAMDPKICNSQSMRSFWSLAVESPTHSRGCLSLLHAHDPRALVSQKQLSSPRNTKLFVQHWLQEDVSETKSEMEIYCLSLVMWLLQRPALVVGGVSCAIVLLPPSFRLYQWLMVSTNIRLDFLVLSWVAAAFLGREYERQSRESASAMLSRKQGSHPSTDTLEEDETMSLVDVHSVTSEEEAELYEGVEGSVVSDELIAEGGILSSPLPEHPGNGGVSCWSRPENDIFRVRGATYLQDRIKIPSAPAPFHCRGVDIWLTDNPERHISRHPSVLGGKLGEDDTFVVNFLLPFGNFVAYFGIPPIDKFPSKLGNVWTKFLEGDQQYRDARLKLLPVVVDGPWIVRAAVGPGTSPALLGKVIPLQYYFRSPSEVKKGVYEVDVIITASRIAKGILNVVKGHTKMLTMAFAFIIEAAEEEELPETVLCTFQMHSIHLEDCPPLPEYNLDEIESTHSKHDGGSYHAASCNNITSEIN